MRADQNAEPNHPWRTSDPSYDAYKRAELTATPGRALGLPGRFGEADALLDAVDGDRPPAATGRV